MKTLVFSIGLNGYDLGYRSCLTTQERYARRIGADYRVVRSPFVDDPALAAWLKIPLLLEALDSGYEQVAYIDADCKVSANAPSFEGLLSESDGKICMSLGRSGRMNSGVIFAQNTSETREFLERVMDSITQEIPAEDRANLRFENGNIIYIAAKYGGVFTIPNLWNNSSDPAMEDHIRHFTGPMKPYLRAPIFDRFRFQAKKLFLPRARKAPISRSVEFKSQLIELSKQAFSEFVTD